MLQQAMLAIIVVGIFVAFSGAFEAAAEPNYPVTIVPQLGHSDVVRSVALSPDGKRALSASGWTSAPGELKLWDLATGREMRKFDGHSLGVTSVAFSPNGKLALSGSWDHTLRLWDLATGAEIRAFEGHSQGVTSVAFSPDGQFALSGSYDRTLRLWDVSVGREIRKFENHSDAVSSVAFLPDGKAALSGSHDGTIALWELDTGRVIRRLRGDWRWITSIAVSHDGKAALSGSERGVVILWNLATGQKVRELEDHNEFSAKLAISPDGKTAMIAENEILKLWDLATGSVIREFQVGSITSIAFSHDGRFILCGGAGRNQLELSLWDVSSGRKLQEFKGRSAHVSSVAFVGGTNQGLVGSHDHTLRLWDLASGKLIRSFQGHSDWISSVAVSPNGDTALSGSRDRSVRLWDLATGRQIREFLGHSDAVSAVSFVPNTGTALSGSERSLKQWQLDSGQMIREFKHHWSDEDGSSGWMKRENVSADEGPEAGVASIAVLPSSGSALTYGSSGLQLWDLTTGRRLHRWGGSGSTVAISPDGKIALFDSFGWEMAAQYSLEVFDLTAGRGIRNLKGHSNHVSSVAVAADGQSALSGSVDGTVRLWELRSGRETQTLRGHLGSVESIAISRAGNTAISGGADGTVRVWDLNRGKELAAMMASPNGDQLAITPEGFFTASQRDTDMLAIVRGLEVTTIGQIHQSLFNPDLVREALAGDAEGEVRKASDFINLDKVLDSGPTPLVEIISPASGSKSGSELVTVAARITDRGKGIGRIEWRVNGITVGVKNDKPAGAGPTYEVTRELALDPADNMIEVVAYNARNLLASLPAQTTIAYTGPTDKVKPSLYVLAIGIDKYVNTRLADFQVGSFGYRPGWTTPPQTPPFSPKK